MKFLQRYKRCLSLCMHVGCMYFSELKKSRTSLPHVFLSISLPLAEGNPIATGTRTQEVQVSSCNGALQSPRGSQQSFFECRSPGCSVRCEWLKVNKEMIAHDIEERADSRQSV